MDYAFDITYKERIQEVHNAFTLGHLKRTIKGDPYAFEVHQANLDHMAKLFQLENAIAAATGHACDI